MLLQIAIEWIVSDAIQIAYSIVISTIKCNSKEYHSCGRILLIGGLNIKTTTRIIKIWIR